MDCIDASDEKSCGCPESTRSCGEDGKGITQCVREALLCDGIIDCFNGKDERECADVCPEGMTKYVRQI